MMIKKYQAKTQEDALENARRELGNDITLLSSRLVSAKGIFRLFKNKLIEVTVAMGEKETKNVAQAKIDAVVSPDSGQKPQFSIFTPEMIAKTEIKTEKDVKNTEIEEKLDNLHDLLEKQITISKAKTEVEIKGESQEKNSEKMKFMRLIYNTLLDNEVLEQYANQIIEEVEKSTKENTPIDQILAQIYQKMILKFGKPEGIKNSPNKPKLLFFIGATGVGKTTTIAKIASKFRVEEKKDIALVTADTYRIAAAEQLKTYANILEVPFCVTYNSSELNEIVDKYKDKDFIIVDTAGHSQNNEELKGNIIDIINSVNPEIEKEVFLVVSATTKYKDLTNIVSAYIDEVDFKIVFTKLDETSTLGNLFNLHQFSKKPLSYITCGQNVPDDIENFNPQKTVKQILGGKR